MDPWANFGNDILPLTNFPVTRGSVRSRSSGRLMTVDAFENSNEFKVMCEVSTFLIEKNKSENLILQF